ncbi:hypothetical protein DLP3_092 [Stenotrophomonas phage vB_SmaS_DLP_3]|nr:hypothetical protein DLP3_092 [Stenotrophomonas phage vB_SmaS_DLP_3]
MNVEGKIAEAVAAYNVELKGLTKKLLIDVNQALKEQDKKTDCLKELDFDLVISLDQIKSFDEVEYMKIDSIGLAIRTRR